MVKPGGLMVAATINRTLKSFALAIVGAEYVLRWLPRGTHQWEKFVTPDELEIAMEKGGLRVCDERGVIYDLIADRWRLARDTDVNYMLTAERTI
jgi:2-polyprenyl-6-hydroxyphenyl methylase / 3-demethylubiquinone-9 3-methyltransferase